jgi:hypothetical protein
MQEGLTVEQLQEQRNNELSKITGGRKPPFWKINILKIRLKRY